MCRLITFMSFVSTLHHHISGLYSLDQGVLTENWNTLSDLIPHRSPIKIPSGGLWLLKTDRKSPKQEDRQRDESQGGSPGSLRSQELKNLLFYWFQRCRSHESKRIWRCSSNIWNWLSPWRSSTCSPPHEKNPSAAAQCEEHSSTPVSL